MAVLSVQRILTTGLEPAALAAAAGGGDSFANTGRELVEINNASGGDITVTFTGQAVCNQGLAGASHSVAVVITAGERRLIGPFDPAKFNDTNNLVQMTYSGVTTLTLGVYSFPSL